MILIMIMIIMMMTRFTRIIIDNHDNVNDNKTKNNKGVNLNIIFYNTNCG